MFLKVCEGFQRKKFSSCAETKLVPNSKPHIYEYYFSVFKGSIVGKWLEYASTFSNMNIFSSVLTSEKMMEKTSTLAMEDDCVGAGDYLRWTSWKVIEVLILFSCCSLVGMPWCGMFRGKLLKPQLQPRISVTSSFCFSESSDGIRLFLGTQWAE